MAHTSRSIRPYRAAPGHLSLCLILLAGSAAMLSACDDGTANGQLAVAANQLRVAPAKGIDEEGNNLVPGAYAQAASTAQGSSNAAAALIAADAIAAQAQTSFKVAAGAWSGITNETASGQALVLRLANEQAMLADLQAFDPSQARAAIAASRTQLQQALRAAETQRDEIAAEFAAIEQAIAEQRAQARTLRDAAEALREQAMAIGGTRRAELIEQANERQRESDGFERKASELGLELEQAGFRRQAADEALDAVRRQLESLMQRERTLEAEVARRAQQASDARQNINELSARIAGQINTMAEVYNAEIAPALAEAISGFESAASRARQAQNAAGSAARLSAGASEHALAATHRAHAIMLGSMLSCVDMAMGRGVSSDTITSVRQELEAKLAEANTAAEQASEQAAGSLSGAGASGRAGEILNEVANALQPQGANPDAMPDDMSNGMDEQEWTEEPGEDAGQDWDPENPDGE